MRKWFWAAPLASAIVMGITMAEAGASATETLEEQITRYARDTRTSFDCMRGENGFVADKLGVLSPAEGGDLICPTVRLYDPTSPTNIALDLLQLAEQSRWETIETIVTTLERAPYDAATGLFYNRYDLSLEIRPEDYYLSSIDNMHLALALWVLAEAGPYDLAARSKGLFERMSFAELQDPNNGLVHGGISLRSGERQRDEWVFSFFGSEGRIVYSLGWALGLVPRPVDLSRVLIEINKTTYREPLLNLWDGGAFQLLLPEILLGESRYSPELKELMANYSQWVIEKSYAPDQPLPMAYSACQIGPRRLTERGEWCGTVGCYIGKAGHRDLIATSNMDQFDPLTNAHWEMATTLHAVVMAGLFRPEDYFPRLKVSENLGPVGQPLYRTGLGWLDSFMPDFGPRGATVPVVLSLDQGMIVLTLGRLMSPDGESYSSRFLRSNPSISGRLQEIYNHWGVALQQAMDK